MSFDRAARRRAKREFKRTSVREPPPFDPNNPAIVRAWLEAQTRIEACKTLTKGGRDDG